MTTQIEDRILWRGESRPLMTPPPLSSEHARIERRDDHSCMNTACWRGYVATWEVRADQLFLARVKGRYGVRGAPVFARWVTAVLLFADTTREADVYGDYGSRCSAVFELDVRVGRIHRWRRIEARGRADREETWSAPRITPTCAVWEWLSEWPQAFLGGSCQPVGGWSDPPPPSRQRGRDRALRERIRTERLARGLRPSDLSRLAGMAAHKGSRIVEFERGHRELNIATIEALLSALDLGDEAQAEIRSSADAAHQAAWDLWADEPIAPSIRIDSEPRRHLYLAPNGIWRELALVRAWAAACARIAWRSVVVEASRRHKLEINLDGVVVAEERISWERGPD